MISLKMKTKLVVLVAGFELLAGYASVANAQGSRCDREDFPMIPVQGLGRNIWTAMCAKPQLRFMWEDKMGNPRGMSDEKIAEKTTIHWSYASEGVMRDRPFYPTFGKETTDEVWRAPVSPIVACTFDPTGYQIMGLCRSNPEKINSRISTADGDKSVSEIVGDASISVVFLANDLGDNEPVLDSTQAIVPKAARKHATIEVLNLEMSSGRSIRINKSHRFVTGKGGTVRASDLRKSDTILDSQGQRDTVMGIKSATYSGPTFVISSKEAIHKKAITVTEGYLDATSWHRLDDLDLVDKRMARHSIPDHLVAD